MWRSLVAVGIMVACVGAVGCAGPFGVGGSPAQLKELIKVKDSSLTCAKGVYAGVTVTVVAASVDKGVYGTVTSDENCKVTVTTNDTRQPGAFGAAAGAAPPPR